MSRSEVETGKGKMHADFTPTLQINKLLTVKNLRFLRI